MPFLIPLFALVAEALPALAVGGLVLVAVNAINEAANAQTAAEARARLAEVDARDTAELRRVYDTRRHSMSPAVRREFEAALAERGAL